MINCIGIMYCSVMVLQIEEFAPDLSKHFLQCYQMKDTQNIVRILVIVLLLCVSTGSRGFP